MPKIDLEWGSMAFTEFKGPDPPFLFLHGTGCDTADWMKTIQAIEGTCQIISVDFRGHGQSSVSRQPFTLQDLSNDVVALVNHLKISAPILVGRSLGGMVAMDVAQKGLKTSGLILLEGWTRLGLSSSAFNVNRVHGSLSNPEIERIRHKTETTKARVSEKDWTFFWDSVRSFDASSFLETTSTPIFEVYGAMERTDYTERELAVPSNPQIRWEWIPDSGHYLPHERPDAVAEICVRFRQTISNGNQIT